MVTDYLALFPEFLDGFYKRDILVRDYGLWLHSAMSLKELLQNCLEVLLVGPLGNANAKNDCLVEIVGSQHEANEKLSLSLLALHYPSVTND